MDTVTSYPSIFMCFSIFLAHLWMLFSHKYKMGSDKTDNSHDHLFSRKRMYISFSFLIFMQFIFLLRRTLIEFGFWDVKNLPLNILNYFSWQPTPLTTNVGVLIFVFGFLLRLKSIQKLGRLFTYEIGIRQQHHIIQDGIYGWIRHPSYTGYLIMLMGMGITYSSFLFLISIFFGTLVFLLLRIADEETMLIKYFGTEYINYQSRTKKLIPYIF